MKKVTNYEISLKTHQFKQSIHKKIGNMWLA